MSPPETSPVGREASLGASGASWNRMELTWQQGERGTRSAPMRAHSRGSRTAWPVSPPGGRVHPTQRFKQTGTVGGASGWGSPLAVHGPRAARRPRALAGCVPTLCYRDAHAAAPRRGEGGVRSACGALPGLMVGRCGGRRLAVCQGHRSGTGSVDPWRLLPSQGRARTPARQKPPRKPRGCVWNSRPLGGSRENLSHDTRVSATMGLRGGVTRGEGEVKVAAGERRLPSGPRPLTGVSARTDRPALHLLLPRQNAGGGRHVEGLRCAYLQNAAGELRARAIFPIFPLCPAGGSVRLEALAPLGLRFPSRGPAKGALRSGASHPGGPCPAAPVPQNTQRLWAGPWARGGQGPAGRPQRSFPASRNGTCGPPDAG